MRDENERRKGSSQLSSGSQRHEPLQNQMPSYLPSKQEKEEAKQEDNNITSKPSPLKNESTFPGFFASNNPHSSKSNEWEIMDNASDNDKNISKIN